MRVWPLRNAESEKHMANWRIASPDIVDALAVTKRDCVTSRRPSRRKRASIQRRVTKKAPPYPPSAIRILHCDIAFTWVTLCSIVASDFTFSLAPAPEASKEALRPCLLFVELLGPIPEPVACDEMTLLSLVQV